jgi:hypothetical protein
MTADLLEGWANKVWERRYGTVRNPASLAFLDPIFGQLSEKLNMKFQRIPLT